MVTRLFATPIVNIIFDDRTYHLGDSIDVTIVLDGTSEHHHVRSGDIELVATVSYSEIAVSSEYPHAGGDATSPFFSVPRPRSVRAAHHYDEEYTVAAINCVKDDDEVLDERRYSVQVPVGSAPPPNWQKGTVTFRLVVAMNLAGERDVHTERNVTVVLLAHK
ncbi:MAG: hypothetical protein O3C69_06750 [Chloroflexi bacterium]|nr:hypothetical protein [Chloroflexota bacterium]